MNPFVTILSITRSGITHYHPYYCPQESDHTIGQDTRPFSTALFEPSVQTRKGPSPQVSPLIHLHRQFSVICVRPDEAASGGAKTE